MFFTLWSNSSIQFYPENKVSDYIVHLPKELNFTGPWEVGLAEFIYPNSWYSIDIDNYWVHYRSGYVQTRTKILPGYYQHPQHLVEQLLQQMKRDFEARNQKLIVHGTLVQPMEFLLDLRYNVYSQLTEIHIKHKPGAPVQIDKEGKEHPAVTLRLAPFLAEIMGFKNIFFHKVGVYTSDRVFDMDPVSALYLYCDVIEPRTVGHTLASLLGVIPIEGKSEANVAKRYEKLQYYPLLKKNISDIHISLRDDQGKTIRFCKGKVIVILHFRKQKLNQL